MGGAASGCRHHASASAEQKQAPEQSSLPDSAQSSTSPFTNQATGATNPTHGRSADRNSGPRHESCGETAGAFALLFGIVFQYFSIAPMSGVWGPKSVWRAAKADILSLTSFEVGAFGWMVAFQVGIFGYKLSMATWTYWWMMQIGMVLGFGTAMPVNWWLISQGIKEPCA